MAKGVFACISQALELMKACPGHALRLHTTAKNVGRTWTYCGGIASIEVAKYKLVEDQQGLRKWWRRWLKGSGLKQTFLARLTLCIFVY